MYIDIIKYVFIFFLKERKGRKRLLHHHSRLGINKEKKMAKFEENPFFLPSFDWPCPFDSSSPLRGSL